MVIKAKVIFTPKKLKKDNKNEETKEKQMFKKEKKKDHVQKHRRINKTKETFFF